MVKVIQCPTCGGSSNPQRQRCEYCGNYLLHLSALELTDKKDSKEFHFRSFERFYRLTIWTGTIMLLTLYTIAFAFLSEDTLVLLSPIWFLAFHFGISGLTAETAVRIVLNRHADSFREGLVKSRETVSPLIAVLSIITLSPVIFVFRLEKITSPLKLALSTSVIWAVILYFFFIIIFPSL